jgi:hypothetical protein
MTTKRFSYGVCIVWLIFAFWFVLANRTATGIAEAQSNSPSKPVEQVRKNIQVLKGLPASQLFPLMNLVSASLGVRCNYCHVNNGDDNWVWQSDEKQAKRAARRMMQMVIDLNKNNQSDFRASRVTCYTCHRGQTELQNLPTLPLKPSQNTPDSITEQSKKAEPLPTVRQVLDKYVEAVGGQAKIAKLKTRVLRGIRESSLGNWSLEINVKPPDKFLVSLTVPQQGVIYQGFNGTKGWLKNPREQRAMSSDELAVLKETKELYEVIKVKEPLPEMKVTGIETIGGREAYALESANANNVVEKFYFDVQTGFLIRQMTLTNTVLVPIPEQIDFEDYREMDSVKLPFVIRISNIDPFFNSTRRFTEIKHNVLIDDAMFDIPAGGK